MTWFWFFVAVASCLVGGWIVDDLSRDNRRLRLERDAANKRWRKTQKKLAALVRTLDGEPYTPQVPEGDAGALAERKLEALFRAARSGRPVERA